MWRKKRMQVDKAREDAIRLLLHGSTPDAKEKALLEANAERAKDLRAAAAETSRKRSWEVKSAERFENFTDPGTSSQVILLNKMRGISAAEIADESYFLGSVNHNRYYWAQKISKFWLARPREYDMLTYVCWGLVLSAYALWGIPVVSVGAPVVLVLGLAVFFILNATPLWPKNNIFFEVGEPPNLVAASSKYSFATLVKLFIGTILMCAVPVLVTILRDESKSYYVGGDSYGSAAESYNIGTAVVKIIGSTCLIIVPFVFVLSLAVWDLYLGVPHCFPVNPSFVTDTSNPPFRQVRKRMESLANDTSPSAQRMLSFYENRGGHFHIPKKENKKKH